MLPTVELICEVLNKSFPKHLRLVNNSYDDHDTDLNVSHTDRGVCTLLFKKETEYILNKFFR